MNIYEEAVSKFGAESQIEKMIEECAELIFALQKRKRGGKSNVPEELADVEIMCEQMRIVFGPMKIDSIKKMKISRLTNLIFSPKTDLWS